MSELGYSTIGTGNTSHGANYTTYMQFTAGSSFTADTMHCYTAGLSGSINLTMGIYADSSGVPGTKLGTTVGLTGISTTQAWQSAALQSPVSITSGSIYWLALCVSGDSNEKTTSGGSWASRYLPFAYSAGSLPASNPAGTASWHTNLKFSIYADAAAPTFNPAWARNSNTILGAFQP